MRRNAHQLIQNPDCLAVPEWLPYREATGVERICRCVVTANVRGQPQQVERPTHQPFVVQLLREREALRTQLARGAVVPIKVGDPAQHMEYPGNCPVIRQLTRDR